MAIKKPRHRHTQRHTYIKFYTYQGIIITIQLQ